MNATNDINTAGRGRDDATAAHGCAVRPFADADLPAVEALAYAGLLPDYVGVDSGDLREIGRLYRPAARGHFWVAEAGGRVIGMVAIAEVTRDVGHVRWLRVAPPWQGEPHAVARALVRAAADAARDDGLIKLLFHAPPRVQPDVAAFLHALGFEHSRTTRRSGRDTMEFYLNLYERPDEGPVAVAGPPGAIE